MKEEDINWSQRRYIKEEFIEAWYSSNTMNEVSQKLGYARLSDNRFTIKKYAEILNLTDNHFRTKKLNNRKSDYSLEKILVIDSNYTNTASLKNRLIKNNIIVYKCDICFISKWLDDDISLQLDHINGDPRDNRLENLRLLCPNCHALTDTYCSKNNKQKKLNICNNESCENTVKKNSKLCKICVRSAAKAKRQNNSIKEIEWTKISCTEEEFRNAWLENKTYTDVGKALNITPRKVQIIGDKLNLDESHMTGYKSVKEKTPLEKILVENGTIGSSRLRKRLITEKVFEEKCYSCGLTE